LTVWRRLLRPQVSLLTERNTFTSAGDTILWAIAQAFKVNTKIMDGSTELGICLRTPVPDGGEPDGAYFRRNMTLQIASYQQV